MTSDSQNIRYLTLYLLFSLRQTHRERELLSLLAVPIRFAAVATVLFRRLSVYDFFYVEYTAHISINHITHDLVSMVEVIYLCNG